MLIKRISTADNFISTPDKILSAPDKLAKIYPKGKSIPNLISMLIRFGGAGPANNGSKCLHVQVKDYESTPTVYHETVYHGSKCLHVCSERNVRPWRTSRQHHDRITTATAQVQS